MSNGSVYLVRECLANSSRMTEVEKVGIGSLSVESGPDGVIGRWRREEIKWSRDNPC